MNKYQVITVKGKQTEIIIGNSQSSGIQLTINKSKKTIYISGWYDSFVGIQGAEIPLKEITDLFPHPKEKELENAGKLKQPHFQGGVKMKEEGGEE